MAGESVSASVSLALVKPELQMLLVLHIQNSRACRQATNRCRQCFLRKYQKKEDWILGRIFFPIRKLFNIGPVSDSTMPQSVSMGPDWPPFEDTSPPPPLESPASSSGQGMAKAIGKNLQLLASSGGQSVNALEEVICKANDAPITKAPAKTDRINIFFVPDSRPNIFLKMFVIFYLIFRITGLVGSPILKIKFGRAYRGGGLPSPRQRPNRIDIRAPVVDRAVVGRRPVPRSILPTLSSPPNRQAASAPPTIPATISATVPPLIRFSRSGVGRNGGCGGGSRCTGSSGILRRGGLGIGNGSGGRLLNDSSMNFCASSTIDGTGFLPTMLWQSLPTTTLISPMGITQDSILKSPAISGGFVVIPLPYAMGVSKRSPFSKVAISHCFSRTCVTRSSQNFSSVPKIFCTRFFTRA